MDPQSLISQLAKSGAHQPTLSPCQKNHRRQVEIPKVVPLIEEKRRVIATDQKSQRMIVGIGQQRIAIDLFTRFTRLPPHTGDQPAPVVTMKKKRK